MVELVSSGAAFRRGRRCCSMSWNRASGGRVSYISRKLGGLDELDAAPGRANISDIPCA